MQLILDWYEFLSCEPKLFCDCRKSRDKSNICAQLFSTLLHAKKDKKNNKILNVHEKFEKIVSKLPTKIR